MQSQSQSVAATARSGARVLLQLERHRTSLGTMSKSRGIMTEKHQLSERSQHHRR